MSEESYWLAAPARDARRTAPQTKACVSRRALPIGPHVEILRIQEAEASRRARHAAPVERRSRATAGAAERAAGARAATIDSASETRARPRTPPPRAPFPDSGASPPAPPSPGSNRYLARGAAAAASPTTTAGKTWKTSRGKLDSTEN